MSDVVSVLRCPACSGQGLIREPQQLSCGRCRLRAPLTDAGFYRTASQRTDQSQSLLAQQATDFYTNAVFKDFVLTREVAALRAAIEALKPECWVDVGCGTGGHAATFAGWFGTYVGL